jgi:DNA polymerase I-like protein with 3'-5' exonuclease and polymerase domains
MVKRCIKATEIEVVQNGYVVNEFGRYRRFSKEDLSDKKKYRSFRQAFNHRIQSTAADLFKFAITRVDDRIRGTGIRFLNFVHDEIQMAIPKNKLHYLPEIKKDMEDFKFSVPITVDISYAENGNWASKKSIENLEEFCAGVV